MWGISHRAAVFSICSCGYLSPEPKGGQCCQIKRIMRGPDLDLGSIEALL